MTEDDLNRYRLTFQIPPFAAHGPTAVAFAPILAHVADPDGAAAFRSYLELRYCPENLDFVLGVRLFTDLISVAGLNRVVPSSFAALLHVASYLTYFLTPLCRWKRFTKGTTRT